MISCKYYCNEITAHIMIFNLMQYIQILYAFIQNIPFLIQKNINLYFTNLICFPEKWMRQNDRDIPNYISFLIEIMAELQERKSIYK